MNWLLLLSLALAPVVAVILFVYFGDKHEKEPLRILAYSFLWGCLSVIPAIMLEWTGSMLGLEDASHPFFTAMYSFGVVALSEEFSKYLFIRYYCFSKPSFDEPFDGIVYSVMVGMGFAALENVGYVFGGKNFNDSLYIALFRMVSAIPAHATFAIVMGYYIGLAKFRHERSLRLFSFGLLSAIMLHGTYDFFLIQRYSPGLAVGAIVSLAVGVALSLKAIQIHRANSPFRPLL